MGVDLVVLHDCRPRRELGRGDLGEGTQRILAGVKARNRAEAVADLARKDGGDPEALRIRVMRTTPAGTQEEAEVGYRELMSGYEPLRPYEPDCDGCPANIGKAPFGCNGYVNYPIPAAAEEWIVARLQPPDTAGGQLLLRGIQDFGLDGAPVRGYRANGLLGRPEAAARKFKTGFLSSKTVTADQVYQAIFCVGEPLNPAHAFGILLWLGCLRIDGGLPTVDQVQHLLSLNDPADRATAARLDLGPPSGDDGVRAMQRMLFYLHRGWVLGDPLLVDA